MNLRNPKLPGAACVPVLLLLLLGACTAGDAKAPAEVRTEAPLAPDGRAVLTGSGPWTAVSSGGSHVSVSLDTTPLVAGAVDLSLSIHPAREGAEPRSVDLVAPEMIMHGVVRTPVRRMEDGRFTVRVEVPMEGLWAFYVNLDEAGGDAAEFRYEVLSGAEGSHPHHAPAPPAGARGSEAAPGAAHEHGAAPLQESGASGHQHRGGHPHGAG